MLVSLCVGCYVGYVYFLDAWGENEFSVYAPDGTHPLTEGHTLLVEKLLNQ